MFRAATVPAVSRPAPGPVRRRTSGYPLVRRDPRRFARGMTRIATLPAPAARAPSDWRFFAHSFGAAFLFVSLIIA